MPFYSVIYSKRCISSYIIKVTYTFKVHFWYSIYSYIFLKTTLERFNMIKKALKGIRHI